MITAETLRQCHMQCTMHINGGGQFFGYGFRCVEHPRLLRIEKSWKKTRKTTVEYVVDGASVPNLEAAAERLNSKPEISPQLRATLSSVTKEYVDQRRTLPLGDLLGLAERGLIEWDAGKCRLTDSGREAQEAST